MTEVQFGATDRFDRAVMAAFMRQPDVYWQANDALAPPPEAINFEEHMAHPDTWTMATTFGQHIVGYVQLVRRTTVGAEIHAGFHPQFRGRVAKAAVEMAVNIAFTVKNMRTLWAIVASDNRAAILGAKACGFTPCGRLHGAVVRKGGLRDLVILELNKTDKGH